MELMNIKIITLNIISKMKLEFTRYVTIVIAAFLVVNCAQREEGPMTTTSSGGTEDIFGDDMSQGGVFVEEQDDPSVDVPGVWNYAALKDLGHPRLFMSEDDFDTLREKVSETGRVENMFLYNIHQTIMNRADGYVTKPDAISYTMDASGRRLLPMSKKAVSGILHLGYAYKITGEPKYFEAAREILATVCSFPDWHPSHYLDVGEMAFAVAVGYDWFYYDLTLAERKLAHKCLKEFALATYAMGPMDNLTNWNQVCLCGLSCAAIAIYEKDKAICRQFMEAMLPSNRIAMEAMYAPDVIYPEGYTYWTYGTGMETILLTALEHAFGTTNGLAEIEGFMETGKYMLFMNGTTGNSFSYSDAQLGEFGKVAMYYFANKSGDLSLLANEKRLRDKLGHEYPGDQYRRILPLVPAMVKDITLGTMSENMPSETMFVGDGVAPLMIIHTGWTFGASDKYVGFKGGKANHSHGHMDAGSFVYEAYGQRWSHDPGIEVYTTMERNIGYKGTENNCWSYINGSKRWGVFLLGPKSHSTFTVNGKEHDVNGEATIEEVYDEAGEQGAKMNLCDVFAGELASAYRTIRLIGEDLYVIDEITAPANKNAEIEWRMMTMAGVAVNGDRIKLTGTNGVAMDLVAESDNDNVSVNYNSWPASGQYAWETENKGCRVAGFTYVVPKGESVTMTVKLSRN